MTTETSAPRSRRALLAASVGGLVAFAVSALGRPVPTRGADGDTVTVGGSFTGTTKTIIENTSAVDGQAAIIGHASAASGGTHGLAGYSDSTDGIGVYGEAAIGVWGRSDSADGAGVVGYAAAGSGWPVGVSGQGDRIGVYGAATAATGEASGVHGRSDSTRGAGVVGQSTANSTGLLGHSRLGRGQTPTAAAKTGVYGYADQDTSAKGVYGRSTVGAGGYFGATTGYALRSSGRVRFEKSAGLATIAATSNKVTVSPGIDLTAGSKVLATLQTSAGGTTTVHRVVRDTANDEFTIYLTAPATQSCTVAWFVIS